MDLIDGDTNTCLPITSHTIGRATPQYDLGINSMCAFTGQVVTLSVTMGIMATCNDLRNILYLGNPSDHFSMCDINSESQSGDKRQCVMRCECGVSADQCCFKIYTGFHRHNINICEITAS